MMIAGMWKIFIKADRPSWAVIIPFYNNWVLSEISGRPGWWSLASVIPVLSWVWWIVMSLDLAQRFGKGKGFVVFLVLAPPIGLPTVGFGKAKYKPID
jgi:hypothetical protein